VPAPLDEVPSVPEEELLVPDVDPVVCAGWTPGAWEHPAARRRMMKRAPKAVEEGCGMRERSAAGVPAHSCGEKAGVRSGGSRGSAIRRIARDHPAARREDRGEEAAPAGEDRGAEGENREARAIWVGSPLMSNHSHSHSLFPSHPHPLFPSLSLFPIPHPYSLFPFHLATLSGKEWGIGNRE
jgi:hypothetical protein